jgi:pimeloyl-ACP methyl ester carboxylesterase
MTNYRSAVGAQQPSTLVLDGISIPHTDSGGSGLVVICLHAGDGARDFEDLSRRLSPQYRVIALDFPNQGNSDPDSQPASATRYTQILAQCIDKLHLPGVVLLGNSIGGAVSIRYASQHPERVKAIVASLLPHVCCPVLLAWAKDDFVVPLKRSAPSFQVFPNHRLEVFEGGHAAFLGDPGRFKQGLRGFLNQVCAV